jgi:hypothetical protein
MKINIRSIVFGIASLLLLLNFSNIAEAQFTTDWERSRTSENLPSWFGADTERGFAVANGKIYVASRNAATNVVVLDATTGADDGSLSVAGIAGGTFAINDAGASEDGVVFAANLTVDASSSAFKVYTWANNTADPVVALEFTAAVTVRLGDKFNVTGSVADGTAKIWAASATAALANVYVWSMTDGAFNATPQIITLSDNITGGSAAVGPTPDGSFWFSYNGAGVKKYQADGTLIGIVESSVVATGSNATSHVGYTEAGDEIVAVYAYGDGNHNARVLTVPNNDPAVASLIYATPSQGSQANGNGAGDTHTVLNADGSYTVFVFSTNNGIGSYTSAPGVIAMPVDPNAPLAGTYYIPQGANSAGFASLTDAANAVNDRGVSGPVTFLIDDNIDEAGGTVRFFRSDLTAETRVTIKPAPGKQVTVSLGDIRFVQTSYFTVDGSANGDGSRDLTILKNAGSGAALGVYGNSRDAEIKNINILYDVINGRTTYAVIINRQETTGVNMGQSIDLMFTNNKVGSGSSVWNDGMWLFGDAAAASHLVHENTTIHGNEFHIGRSAVRTQTHVNTIFDGNFVMSHGSPSQTESAAFSLNTPINSFEFTNNEIVFVETANAGTATFIGLNATNTIVNEVPIINNMFSAVNVSGAGTDHNFYAFRHAGSASTAAFMLYHNTIRFGDTGFSGDHVAVAKASGASSAATVDFVNNIVSLERDAANSMVYSGWAGEGVSSSTNNIFLAGDASVGNGGSETGTTFAPVEFVSANNLRLTGASIGDQNLAGTPIEFVTVDIDGNVRSAERPYKGAFESDAITTSMESLQTAQEFKLNQNYPNPFNPSTTINFVLPTASNVTLQVFTVTGQLVATLVNESRAAGEHSVNFNASNLSSGVYIYRITAGSFTQTQRMTLVK